MSFCIHNLTIYIKSSILTIAVFLMFDFLPLSFTSVSHRHSVSSANSSTSDEISEFSLSEHGAYDTPIAPSVMHVENPCKVRQAEFTTQTSSKSPSSLLSQIGKWNHSMQISSKHSLFSSSGNRSRSPLSSFTIARKGLGKKREALETLTDGSQSESEPINVGNMSSHPKQEMNQSNPPISSLTRLPARVRKVPGQMTSQPSSTTRSPFVSRDTSVQPNSHSNNLSDDFSDLNIQAALFPTGRADSYSPAALNSLARKAEQLLSRMQMAYKDCKTSLREVIAEKETQAEELESCRMRVRHLQIQLDKMTAKFVEQEQARMKLVDELAREKYSQQLQEPRTPKRGAKPTKTARADSTYKNAQINSELLEARRGSDVSTLSIISDSGFESDEESLTNVPGQKHQDTPSPSASVSSMSTTHSRDFTRITKFPPPAISYPEAIAQPARPKGPAIRTSGFIPSPKETSAAATTLQSAFDSRCSNCQGVHASEAWDVVGVLQGENRFLKERLGNLEGHLDGCLDLIRAGRIASY